MTRYALFLRGINVGGVRVPMPQLRATLERLGSTDVRTWLNTGNVALDDERDAGSLKSVCEAALEEEFEYEAYVLVRPLAELADIVAAYPFAPHPDMHRYVVFAGAAAEAAVVDALTNSSRPTGASGDASDSRGLVATSGSTGLEQRPPGGSTPGDEPVGAPDTSETVGGPANTTESMERVAVLGEDLMWLCPKGSTTSSDVGKILARKDLKPLVTTRNLNTIEKML